VTISGDISGFLEKNLNELHEKSILVISSKVVSILQGRVVKKSEISKKELIIREADLVFPSQQEELGMYLTSKNNILIPNAGIDESNISGEKYVLWPEKPQKTVNIIWESLKKKFRLEKLGVMIIDSTIMPLRTGTIAVCLAHCGFKGIRDYRKKEDLFERELEFTAINIRDNLASAANITLGEGDERRPLAVITDIPEIEFQNELPTKSELKSLRIPEKIDLFGQLL
jgi:F420-0:gamma-glutamyl ligase